MYRGHCKKSPTSVRKVPYYLVFYPETQDLTLYRHNHRKYDTVKPTPQGAILSPNLTWKSGYWTAGFGSGTRENCSRCLLIWSATSKPHVGNWRRRHAKLMTKDAGLMSWRGV
jgi:hypothetical protein